MASTERASLIVLEVSVGVANMDVSTDDGVVSGKVVVQEITAVDRESQESREFLLLYDAEKVPDVADALRTAAERAASAET
jgi:hypothetical protein